MALTKYKLGELIEYCDNRNTDSLYSELDVRGISNTKELMPTKADLLNRSLAEFKVVHPNEFVYNRRTTRMGDKLAITYNSTDKPVILTNDYIVFKVIKEDILLNEYLFMFFNRPEFDRYARFNSWGSATEMFVWESMCDVDISLPSIKEQRKYVDIYLSLQDNLAVYQSKVAELKLACDGFLDQLKVKSDKVKIGKLLEEVDCRNTGSKIKSVKGININKEFMDSVADTNGVDLSKYKVVHENEFAFSGMQTGRDECIRIALNQYSIPLIVSPAYTVLKIKSRSILSHYILLWFSRKEIDRYGWFASDASIRSNLDLDRFFDMEIPLPSIDVQEDVVNLFRCYIERQQIATQLKEQLSNLCPILIKGSLQTNN